MNSDSNCYRYIQPKPLNSLPSAFCFLPLVFCLLSIVFSLFLATQFVDCAELDEQSLASNSDNAQFYYEPHDVFYLMDEQLITVASKKEEKVKDAPSIVTVITAEEIENMGVKTLTEILSIVPGFDIIKDATFGRIWTGARGIRNADNKIKVLIDGHSLNMPYNGGIAYPFDDLPLKNVKKIEIIRGPGSALYGANAFLAVIT